MNDQDCCHTFADSYDLSSLPAMRKVEEAVLGCDYGGTSWTTMQQATQMIALLDIGQDQHMLDIGAGSGWPALFVADQSGCNVTLVDIPLNALDLASDRANDDGIAERVSAVAASGAALPFDDASFDIVSHSDVLCCLPGKLEMLREYRQSLTTLVEAFRNDADLRDALGDDKIAESLARRQEQVDSIDAGLLIREIFLAVAS